MTPRALLAKIGFGLLLVTALWLPASCGGDVATTAGNGDGCQSHDDCTGDMLCRFATGTCHVGCGDACSPCPTGESCVSCATSACPSCEDCRSLCLPIEAGTDLCDNHDDCATDEVCILDTGTCKPKCDSAKCTDAQACDPQATTTEPCGMVLLEACLP